MNAIASLRSTAVARNLLFMLYGLLGHIYPVLLLYLALLPINLIKLRRIRRRSKAG